MLLKPRRRLRHVTRDSQQFINVGLESKPVARFLDWSNPAYAERTLNGHKLNKRSTIDRKEQYAHAMDAFGETAFLVQTQPGRAASAQGLGGSPGFI